MYANGGYCKRLEREIWELMTPRRGQVGLEDTLRPKPTFLIQPRVSTESRIERKKLLHD